MHCSDQAAALRQCHAELDGLMHGPLADAAAAARKILARRDGAGILAAAGRLRQAGLQYGVSAEGACAALVLASLTLTTAPPAPRSIGSKLP